VNDPDCLYVCGRDLKGGDIRVGGFKHAFVSVVAGCLAARSAFTIRNAPEILERTVIERLLRDNRVSVHSQGTAFRMDCARVQNLGIDSALSSTIHGSVYLVPALVAACGRAELRGSGGCAIGDGKQGRRPTAHMVDVLRKFGATVESDDFGGLACSSNGLSNAEIDIMDYSLRDDALTGPHISGATKTAIIAALGTAPGQVSRIRNYYSKPDVTDLLAFIAERGGLVARSDNELRIAPLSADPDTRREFSLTPDVSEVITYIVLAAMAGVQLTLHAEGMEQAAKGLKEECRLLAQMGFDLNWQPETLLVAPPAEIRSVDIDVTSTGIFSDHQPFFALLLTKGDRPSVIREYVWKTRFSYADELAAFGAKIERMHSAIRVFPSQLHPPSRGVQAQDLRMASVLLIAALSLDVPVRLTNMRHLERGYSQIWQQMQSIGAIVHTCHDTVPRSARYLTTLEK